MAAASCRGSRAQRQRREEGGLPLLLQAQMGALLQILLGEGGARAWGGG